MDNENKWEYDYSSQDKNESGDTGYPNVGSSGMNTANQYNDPQPEPETAYTAPQTDNGAGGATRLPLNFFFFLGGCASCGCTGCTGGVAPPAPLSVCGAV